YPIFYYSSIADRARRSRVDADHASLAAALKMYSLTSGRPPTTEQGLDVLVNEPEAEPMPTRRSRIMDRALSDPWGNSYRYRLLSDEGGEWRWELRSAGPDRVFETRDDVMSEGEWR